jgi:hypothetical protein
LRKFPEFPLLSNREVGLAEMDDELTRISHQIS